MSMHRLLSYSAPATFIEAEPAHLIFVRAGTLYNLESPARGYYLDPQAPIGRIDRVSLPLYSQSNRRLRRVLASSAV